MFFSPSLHKEPNGSDQAETSRPEGRKARPQKSTLDSMFPNLPRVRLRSPGLATVADHVPELTTIGRLREGRALKRLAKR